MKGGGGGAGGDLSGRNLFCGSGGESRAKGSKGYTHYPFRLVDIHFKIKFAIA